LKKSIFYIILTIYLIIACGRQSPLLQILEPHTKQDNYTAADSMSWRPFAPKNVQLFSRFVYNHAGSDSAAGSVMKEEVAAQILDNYLTKESPETAGCAENTFHDEISRQKIPNPSLRVAFAALCGTIAEPAIDYALHQTIDNGYPKVVKIIFGPLSDIRLISVAQFQEDESIYIIVNQAYRGTNPFTLTNVLAHELLHQDGLNCDDEELSVYALNSLVYMQQLIHHPELAWVDDYQNRWNNTQAMARLNSGQGSELGIFQTNGNQPAFPGSLMKSRKFVDAFLNYHVSSETSPGNKTLDAFLQVLKNKESSIPDPLNFNTDLLLFLDKNWGEDRDLLTSSDLLKVARALQLNIEKPDSVM